MSFIIPNGGEGGGEEEKQGSAEASGQAAPTPSRGEEDEEQRRIYSIKSHFCKEGNVENTEQIHFCLLW